jgi:hypothetical protein
MDWPQDATGAVFRRLQETGFDFARPVAVDFNVEFDDNTLAPQAAAAIASSFPEATVSAQDDELLVQIEGTLTYRMVIETLAKLSDIAAPFGGFCDDWGVLVRASAS